MDSILDAFGWMAVLGGAVLTLRALILHTSMRSDDLTPTRRPSVGLSQTGRKHLFRGILLLIIGHILKDVVPSFIDQLPGA